MVKKSLHALPFEIFGIYDIFVIGDTSFGNRPAPVRDKKIEIDFLFDT